MGASQKLLFVGPAKYRQQYGEAQSYGWTCGAKELRLIGVGPYKLIMVMTKFEGWILGWLVPSWVISNRGNINWKTINVSWYHTTP